MLSRRNFNSAMVSTAFASLALASCKNMGDGTLPKAEGYGNLIDDPANLLDLPKDFSYRVLSKFGDVMADGYAVPDRADGMGAIDLGGGKFALIRNHEMNLADLNTTSWRNGLNGPEQSYDKTKGGVALMGGTTTMIIDQKSGQLETQHLSLAGTIRNCAGGVMPWGSWLSCEEDVTLGGAAVSKDHGWIFEVPARQKGLVAPVPLHAMGRFNHEAAAIDPRTGIVYLTEDEDDSLLYRFLPSAKGELAKGGRLQVLGLVSAPAGSDTRNWNSITLEQGKPQTIRWIDIDGADNPNDDLRMRGHKRGAAVFARGEGIHYGANEVFFTCTSGGRMKAGQVMRYRPSPYEGQSAETSEPGTLELFLESSDPNELNYADNLVVAPNGHIVICEDQDDEAGPVDNHIRAITPQGALYTIARLRIQSELAGVCFSPDGSTLFVNVYRPGQTLAITGPWARFKNIT
jgi:secreted PhoX family phosphatase